MGAPDAHANEVQQRLPVDAIHANDGYERETQGVESSQKSLQSSLAKAAGQHSDRLTIVTVSIDGHRYSIPIEPTSIKRPRHFDLIDRGLIQRGLRCLVVHTIRRSCWVS